MTDRDLAEAFAEWTHYSWQLASYDGWTLLLIADNDLSYSHCVEVAFGGVTFIRCPQEFEEPIWTPTDDGDLRLAAQLEGQTRRAAPEDLTAYAWEVAITSGERVRCLVVADSIEVREGQWLHYTTGSDQPA